MAKAKAKKPAKKQRKRKKKSSNPALNAFQLKYATKIKYKRSAQFMLMEFVMLALDLSGDLAEDKALARQIISDIKRP